MHTFQLFYTLGSLSLFAFTLIALILAFVHHHLLPFDMRITNFLRRGTGKSTRFFQAVDRIGSIINLIIFVIILVATLYFTNHQQLAWWLSINVCVIALFLNPFFKLLFHRHRPDVPRLAKSFGYSFPSGHSSGSMIILGSLMLMQPLLHFTGPMMLIGTFIGSAIIGVIGVSRVYLGVHYASDVAAGFLLGLSWLFFSYPVLLLTY
ncbi:phosphatase PAP2 family protein [Periweissella fabaria]|uniref:Phosphatidic acid phosphatase type 2/haloperoxidase domain-containing protein n=1 Tax=Periweissella fabaria TaxID=546157 RepID=A0ABM8Z6L1_9LACO|nr:phosphatase PAP2 family protein [Periweissella fabaria]MCM0597693.1 phosphatase PAP2 family protein [Periweissella fabaria]CAH0416880.1 hypothetical protein WFA24289_01193 [Periweissella fabaria]